ncbi:YjiG family protein [Sutterella sp.]|uniref:YjiG family protein n=1 Tax=Sutterella sp. TaxID=1981025 RepID=UPI003FD8A4D8
MSHTTSSKPMITDVFVKGAVQGWNIAVTSTLPNVLMAFVIIKILNHSGLLKIIGDVCAPVMGVFGLPGEAATVLLGGWMSMGGGVGVAMALYDHGTLTGTHLAILAPSIFLMGSQIQYMGRCLGVIGVKGAKIPVIMAIPILTAFLSLFVMRILVMGS